MKKLGVVISTVAMVSLLVCGCGEKETAAEPVATEVAEEAVAEETPAEEVVEEAVEAVEETAEEVVAEEEVAVEEAVVEEGSTVEDDGLTLTLSDGSVYGFYLPEGQQIITEDYMDLVKKSYSLDDVEGKNIIWTGDTDNYLDSTVCISATTLDGLRAFVVETRGNDVDVDSIACDEHYIYYTTGEIPETDYIDYSIEQVNTITIDETTYTAYTVDYFEKEKDDSLTEYKYLVCFSDTEDTIEITVYTGEYDEEYAIELLGQFLGL